MEDEAVAKGELGSTAAQSTGLAGSSSRKLHRRDGHYVEGTFAHSYAANIAPISHYLAKRDCGCWQTCIKLRKGRSTAND